MSDYEDSTVTYTKLSSLFSDLSDIRSPGVDGPPVMPEDPYAYVVATFHAPPSPDYVPGLEEPEQAPPSPVYAMFLRDDGDDEDESSNDDEDDDVDIKGDEEEEEHPAPAYSTAVALPAIDHPPSTEETRPFEINESAATPPPHPAYQVTARISIRDEPPKPFWSDIEVSRLLAIPTPPPSPISPWSSPLPQIPLPPLPVSPPPPASPTYLLGCRAAMIRLIAEAPSTSHSPPPHIILSHTRADTPPSGTPPLLPIPLPTSSLSLLLPSADHEADKPERDVSYGIIDTWDEMLVDIPGAPATDDTELGQRMIEFTTTVRQDTYEIYVRLDDEQTERQLMAGRINMLYRDRRAHARTTLLMEREAMMYREAWG
ncbi:hypothetical protein Tco_0093671 [Tanacetum coccineum]